MRAVIYILFNWIWNWIILSFPSFNVLVTSFRTLFEVNPRWSSLALLWMFLQLQFQLQLWNPNWMFLQPVSQQETGSIPSIQTAFTIYLVAYCQGALVCFLIKMTSLKEERWKNPSQRNGTWPNFQNCEKHRLRQRRWATNYQMQMCFDVVGKALLVFSTKKNDKADVSHNYDFDARGMASQYQVFHKEKWQHRCVKQ